VIKEKVFYQVYHANLAFSAIEEEDIPKVIDLTYSALLSSVARKKHHKTGLEISGYSLEKIAHYRPELLEQIRMLIKEGLLELIGSGYMQIIGPLVPYKVNIKNQSIGKEVYKYLLGCEPSIVYVNEQVLSKSLIDVYAEVGYSSIMMEWNNAYSNNIEKWNRSYSFQPVTLQGLNYSLPVIWTDTILFQQFQRTAHFEQSIDEYLLFLEQYVDAEHMFVPVYSSDLEIFNYRPGRFETEAKIEGNEWLQIEKIQNSLSAIGSFALPSTVLKDGNCSSVILCPFKAQQPILVKKQDKYSLSRWAACGRDANYINTLCFRLLQEFNEQVSVSDWKQLLVFWGSDYRTHTTLKKWTNVIENISKRLKIDRLNYCDFSQTNVDMLWNNESSVISQVDNKLILAANGLKIVFCLNKGFCLDSISRDGNDIPIGTSKHGKFSDISYSADFFTGSCVIESAVDKKITDLIPIETWSFNEVNQGNFELSAFMKLKDGSSVIKTWCIDALNERIDLSIKLHLDQFINGSIRLGTLTFAPENLKNSLWYSCCNGGEIPEKFSLDKPVSQHKVKSLIQSSTTGIGVTSGEITFGVDETDLLQINLDQMVSTPFTMLENHCEGTNNLVRLYFSLQELDDTLKPKLEEELPRIYELSYRILFKNLN